eukprot:CAMPEP_0202964782 /NCGR_PEP_ID=MMETSP1396-20130829/8882_1 /ASSEMBLY_ACC=CAM_ASM_000872 /TAXON_ID= /ORGANISM="Pseudokeronopsis sp., Strain Brazil" /LENGTH=69 /DNA_ID=CAMNT_0049687157 /DNA_START=50 /DNA_END=259 /DNA_ORIENTATION=-
MPMIGLGSYAIGEDPDIIVKAILEIGYRQIDTASYYQNEEVVGEAISRVLATGKIQREELFVTTKAWVD